MTKGDPTCPICEGRTTCDGEAWHCGAKLRSEQAAEQGRTRCARRAGMGTDHKGVGTCKLHGGCTPNAAKSFGEKLRFERAMGEVGRLLEEVGVVTAGRGHVEVMTDVLDRCGQMVYALGLLIDELDVETEWRWVADEGARGGMSYRVVVEQAGLYGPDHQGDQKPHVLVQLYSEWVTRYAHAAKIAADLGIAERQQKQREELTKLFVTALRHTLGELGIDVDSPEVVPHVLSGLKLIAADGERVA